MHVNGSFNNTAAVDVPAHEGQQCADDSTATDTAERHRGDAQVTCYMILRQPIF